jgi:hypothetical protein
LHNNPIRMAKKTQAKATTPKKAAAPRKKTPTKASVDIAQLCSTALDKLKELNLDYQLQAEIEWCLGSYAEDGNPIGLYQMAERSLHNFKNITAAQPKAVPAKLIKDLEKAVQR